MMQAMGAAVSGLQAEQTWLNTTANNLANLDTIGYKSQETSFDDELSQTLQGGSSATNTNGGSNPEQVGLGVAVGSIQNDMGEGSDETTGNTLDLAIQTANGFFQVATPSPTSGSTASDPVLTGATVDYTRAGNFTTNSEGYLVTQSGQYVVGVTADANGNPTTTQTTIQIPSDAENPAVGSNGQVTYTDPTTGDQVTAGYIQLANFANDAGLSRDGGSLWSATAASGTTATLGTPGQNGMGTIASGELESSNVDMATEFSNMIEAQNGYEADSKVITTADQMLQALVAMPQG